MNCPFNAMEVGKSCTHKNCWMNFALAKHSCAALDTGSTHLVIADVARIYGEKLTHSQERVERGRKKIAAWLALIEKLQGVEGGCAVCGKMMCNGNQCQDVAAMVKIKERLPLEGLIEMNAAKWRVALEEVEKGNLVASLTV